MPRFSFLYHLPFAHPQASSSFLFSVVMSRTAWCLSITVLRKPSAHMWETGNLKKTHDVPMVIGEMPLEIVVFWYFTLSSHVNNLFHEVPSSDYSNVFIWSALISSTANAAVASFTQASCKHSSNKQLCKW